MIGNLHRAGPGGLCAECGEPFPCPQGVAMADARAAATWSNQVCRCGHQRWQHAAYAAVCQASAGAGSGGAGSCGCREFRLDPSALGR